MSTEAGKAYVMKYFENASEGLTSCIHGLAQDPPAVVEQARTLLREDLMDRLAYLDTPGRTLAGALFFSAVHLAVWLALREEGVDVHDFGAAILSHRDELPPVIDEDAVEKNWFEASGRHSGEFKVEIVRDEDYYMGYDITACAECSLYAQYDAMDLMPYMCASDDYDQSQPPGLRRTGTIALGHDHCDFRFRRDDRPPTLAELYPDRIRWVESGS
jgi:hypothetical protein